MTVTINGTSGITTPGLNSTASNVLGDNVADTLNVGNGAIVTNSSGNVGIGVTNPVVKLNFPDSTSIGWGTSNYSYIGGSSASNIITFGTQATERMRIDSSGNLFVGVASGSNKFVASTSSASQGVGYFNASSTSYGSTLVYIDTNTAPGTGYNAILYYNNNIAASMFRVQGNGNVQNYNNSYGSLSDAKLKENVVEASPKLSDLMQVRVVNYNLIGDEKKQIGVVAQELEQVFPGLVEETSDVGADGKALETTTKSVKYSVFVPMLIKAIQEQQVQIEALTTRLTAAEEQILNLGVTK